MTEQKQPLSERAWLGRAKRAGIVISAPIWFLLLVLGCGLLGVFVAIVWALSPLLWLCGVLCSFARWIWTGYYYD